jgi:molecular chaperone DnaK
MTRPTIDFGIDLGTTNSSIAVLNGTGVEVFKNNEGQEYTPSAVWIDGKGKLYVGRLAKERLDDDNENTFSEFKLQMGLDKVYTFAKSGRQMKPEELSAEVLKSLRGDVQQRTGEMALDAVICVPAAFELPQCDATKQAATLAGLECIQLVNEPIAAATAYGFKSKEDGVFWMVYDFGGGTFDVAIIQVRDGQIPIVNHRGNNHLGGKLIDWEIVEKLFVPALVKEYKLTDFNRGSPKWKAAFAKLKLHSENAKIKLSRDAETSVMIDPLCQDDKGTWVKFEYELTRKEIEPLIEPFIERSITLCNETLKESKLATGDIEKLILVGGPTLTPLVRDILSKRLKMPLEFSKDPLTVNAQGAAIFAGGAKIPPKILKKRQVVGVGQYSIELQYQPLGSDTEPMVGGTVIAPEGESLTGCTVEIVQSKTKWRSGQIKLNTKGAFTATLHADEPTNEFLIELKDKAGNILPTVPDRFTIIIGMGGGGGGQILINSMGIALSNSTMESLLEKGTKLPAKKRKIYHTAKELKKGVAGELLRIPVVEGEITRRSDRNRLIGVLEINSDSIKRDVPSGSEVEVTIDVDESRIVTTKAYIPVLDEEYTKVLKYDGTPADPKQLTEQLKREKERYEKAKEDAKRAGIDQTNKGLRKIQDEGMVSEIEATLRAAAMDADAAEKCRKRLNEFAIAIDDAEEEGKWPTQVSEAETSIVDARKMVDQWAEGSDRTDYDLLERETRAAIAARDRETLELKKGELDRLYWKIALRHDETWIALFFQQEAKKSSFTDPVAGAQLLSQGHRAIDSNDIETVKSVVRQIYTLFPEPTPPGINEGHESGVRK